MGSTAEGADIHGVERLILEMARTFNWISLYQSGHSSLAGRVERFHQVLISTIAQEPSGHLLLGIAKDKILYRDVFLGNGHSLVRNFTEKLFLKQIATLDFSQNVSPRDLETFFLCLKEAPTERAGAQLEESLKREGVGGIALHPYNYKEVLSRRIAGSAETESRSEREDALWRMLLTENVTSGAADPESSSDLSIPPEMLVSILRRAQSASLAAEDGAGAAPENSRDPLPPELFHRILARCGELFRKLPVANRCAVLRSLEGEDGDADADGEGDAAQAVVRSLASRHTDDEFLDLLAAVLAAEQKGGQRLRKIFGVIAFERNEDGSLLPRVRGRLSESVRTKNYFAEKAWEAVERLLLERTEDAYLGQDHSKLLEDLSVGKIGPRADGAENSPADPVLAADFDEGNLRRKAANVLLDLLANEEDDGEFLELLEEIRKGVPNLISRKDFPLLRSILSTLTFAHRTASETRRSAIQSVIRDLDFAHMLDLYLSPALGAEDRCRIEETIISFVDVAADDFFDRLLMETDARTRRTLLSLASRFDRRALPAIRALLSDSRWYFVRNLCFILGEIGDLGAAPDLIPLLDHKDFRVRREAIQALGKLRAVEAASALGKVLLHETLLASAKEESLQIEAANALFRCGGTRGAAYLHRGVESRRAKVRNHCSALLRTMEGQP